ncbi:hypothetical protein GQ53DRAFT_756556 [Thozetella sp. PMI_491]|nr:hypothetical protein GQ53DRAFT_756556 [Thozetella sp. PMI_491]
MPGHRVFIENRIAGKPRIVRANSYHLVHRGDERVTISREDLNEMLERERILREQVEQQAIQIQSLKSQLHNTSENLRQARVYNQELLQQNRDLRRSLEDVPESEARHEKKMRELRNRNTRLENDNESLRGRIRELTRKIGDAVDDEVARWRNLYEALERRYNDLSRRHDRMRENLDNYVATNELLQRDLEAARRRLRRHGL